MPRVCVYLLGVPRVEFEGVSVSLERQKALALLAYLVTTNTPHSRDFLATLLWPEADSQQSRASLRRVLATLTKALPGSWWQADRASIALPDHRDVWVDVREYRSLYRELSSSEYPRDDERLQRLIGLYGGDFLAGFTLRGSPEYDDWQLFQTEELRNFVVLALERLVSHRYEAGSYGSALEYARRWSTMDSLSEACHAWLMRLYAASGQRTAALRQYQECERLLGRELGVAPQEFTKELYRRIRDGEEGTAAMAAQPITAEAKAHIKRVPGHVKLSSVSTVPPGLLRPHLVGRERELAAAMDVLERVQCGESGALLIHGEPGIGKTRLAGECLVAAEAAGFTLLRAECLPEAGMPYAPVAQFIRAVLRILHGTVRELPEHVLADLLVLAPELRVQFPSVRSNPPLEPRAEQCRIFDSFVALCVHLAAQKSLVLFLDDLHWIDPASLAMLRHLLKNTPNDRVLFVGTCRDAEASSYQALSRWLLELERDRLLTSLRLAPLSREHVREQLRALLQTEGDISAEFLEVIYHETEGNPFFIEEICKSLLEIGDLYFSGGFWRRKDLNRIVLPKGVRAAILARTDRLPKATQELLGFAAVLGHGFSFETLRQVTLLSEGDLLEALGQAEAMQFIRQQNSSGTPMFAFAHPLIPFAIRESMSGLRLQRLHLQVATALETREGSADVETLARHFLAAGDSQRSFTYSLQAAERAARLFAYETALDHLHRALDLLDPSDEAARLQILERLGDMYLFLGERSQAMEMFDTALGTLGSLPDTNPTKAVRLHRKIIETYGGIRAQTENIRFEERIRASITAGLELVEDLEPQVETVLFFSTLAKDPWGARADHDWQTAEQFTRRAVDTAEQLASPEVLSRALGALGTTLGNQQKLREQVAVTTRRLTLSRSAHFSDPLERLYVLCEAGAAFLRVGEYVQSLSFLLEAERLAGPMRAIDAHLYAVGLQAECLFNLDRWEEMLKIEAKRQALEREYTPQRVGRFCFYCGLEANVLALQGRLEEASQRREEAHAMMSSSMGALASWPRAGLYCRGKALVGLGEYDLVRGELERALQAPASWVGDHDLYAMLVDVAVRQRHEDDLRKYAPLAEQSAAKVGHKLYLAVADRAWGVLFTVTGAHAEAETRLLRALSLFRQYDARWQLARTLLALGELAHARNDADTAEAHFAEAMRMFDVMGAVPDGIKARMNLSAVAWVES